MSTLTIQHHPQEQTENTNQSIVQVTPELQWLDTAIKQFINGICSIPTDTSYHVGDTEANSGIQPISTFPLLLTVRILNFYVNF